VVLSSQGSLKVTGNSNVWPTSISLNCRLPFYYSHSTQCKWLTDELFLFFFLAIIVCWHYNLLMIPPTTVMLQLHVRSLKHQQEITPCLSASTFFLFAPVIKSAQNCLWHLLTWHTCWDINYQSNITSFIYPHLQSAPSWEWPHLDFKEIFGVKRITVPNRHSLPDW